jgi:hypothetical protein
MELNITSSFELVVLSQANSSKTWRKDTLEKDVEGIPLYLDDKAHSYNFVTPYFSFSKAL